MTEDRSTPRHTVPVAIIGIGCIFPQSPDLKGYWRLLLQGKDAIAEVPETHWSPSDYFDDDPKKPDHVYCKRGGFIPPVSFDPSEFGIPPSSLEATDTAQLLGLVAARAALKDAGYDVETDFDRDRVSVVLGVTGTQELVIPLGARLGHPKWRKALADAGVDADTAEDVVRRIADSYVPWQENSFPGLLGNVVAGRICNRLNLGGTNCVVDAACASSMSAIHMGLLELFTGRSDMVVTGGVDMLNDIFMHMCFSRTQILSPTGDARPFSADADGTVLGEGVGLLVLKPLAAAEAAGDRIYAVIRGIGSSSDGKSQSIYAPRPEGQARALWTAYQSAGVDPATVSLVEAHGTGTRVGDAVELKALASVFGPGNGEKRCAVGSVKSMIGHTKAAAGSAGLIKAALALHHKVIPPTLKVDRTDPKLGLDDSPFYIATRRRPWMDGSGTPRRAGVSAFGFGGSNFHMVLEEYEPRKTAPSWDGSVEIIALSGESREAIRKGLKSLKNLLADAASTDGHIAWEAHASRERFDCRHPHRLLLVLDRSQAPDGDLKTALASILNGIPADALNAKNLPANAFYGGPDRPGKLAFAFPGQGSQYVDMGLDLVCLFPDAMAAVDLFAAAFEGDGRLSDCLFPPPTLDDADKKAREATLRRTDIAQPAIGAVSVGMLRVLSDFGLSPEAVCGHSYGELLALHAAGRIDADALARLSMVRGRLMAAAAGEGTGSMAAVKANLKAIQEILDASGLDLVLANRNSPAQGVVSGAVGEIDRFETLCREKGIKCVRLPVSAAFHSPLMQAVRDPFAQALAEVSFNPGETPVYANATAAPYPDDAADARALLADGIIRPVDFIGQIRAMYDAGIRTFVEVGPRTVLTGLISAILADAEVQTVAMDSSAGRRFGVADLATALCRLAALGHPVRLDRWESASEAPPRQRMRIPLSGANYCTEKPQRPPKPATPTPRKPEPEKIDAQPERAQSPVSEAKPNPNPIPPNRPAAPSVVAEKRTAMKTDPVPSSPAPLNRRNPDSVSDALRVVQEGLHSMQALQTQTARTHEKFLEAQTQASRTLQEMMQSTRRLAEAAMGVSADGRAEMAFAPEPTHRQPVQPPAPAEPQPTAPQPAAPEPPLAAATPRPEPAPRPTPTPEPPPSAPVPGPASSGDDALQKALLEVVSELTGYPTEMLSMDMDIEADLGIDSIKRVEILSTMEERIPDLPQVSPEIMGTLRTLGEVATHLVGTPAGGGASAGAAPMTAEASNDGPAPTGSPQNDDLQKTLLDVVSELTGYPTEMLSMDMDIEADLGIDSIKRVEILSTMEERIPDLPQVSPEIMGTLRTLGEVASHLVGASAPTASQTPEAPTPPATPSNNDDFQKTLLEVVSELTGYPTEMLSMEMDIESDLGIDSIKRVEILSTMEERMDNFPAVSPEIMGSLRTLGEIVAHLSGGPPDAARQTAEPPVEEKAASKPQPPTPTPTAKPATGNVQRRTVAVREAPRSEAAPLTIPDGRPVLITEDEAGLAEALARVLASDYGMAVRLIPPDPENVPDDLPAAGGLILLADAWDTGDDPFLKDAFRLAKRFGKELAASADGGGGLFASVSRLDGGFGFRGGKIAAPRQGGLAGLVKTAAREWGQVHCKAIDLAPDWTDADAVARAIAAEAMSAGPVEAGLDRDRRFELVLEPTPYPQGAIDLQPGDVVVMTGGGRGVTAWTAHVLATHVQPTLILMGRSPAPTPEPAWLTPLDDPAAVKKAILTHEFGGHPPTPVQLEDAFRRRMVNREISNTLHRLEAAGATVRYVQTDVRDAAAVSAVLDEVRSDHGPIKALVHGAGMLKDKLIVEKTPEDFSAVYDTKVKGLTALLAATRSDPLRYLVLFSSVSARLGNRGQADYAMANEVLNKMARQEARQRPDCRVLSINWGPWDGGMVTDAVKREFQRNGIALIPAEAGAMCMLQEMMGDDAHPVEVLIGAGFDDPLSLTFKREIDLKRYPVLGDHMLDGKPVVPFALMTEWLSHGALHENPGLVLLGLDDIRLLSGIKLNDAPRLIRLMAGKPRKRNGHFEVAVEIRDGVQDGADVIHSRARAILSNQPAPPPGDAPDLGRFSSGDLPDIDDIYEDVLFHGAALRGIKRIRGISDAGMAADLASAPAPEKWMENPHRSRWVADPLVLDAAFQMAIVWCHAQKGMVSLPSYTAAYRQYCRRFPREGVAAVLEVRNATERKMVGDFTFLDTGGTVVARLTGYEAIMDPLLFQAFKPQPSVVKNN